ncbi:MAG: HAMP domain-containing protein [Desulfobacteraceae bacterium]|nr:HAMP domain-containing protein [Desulfobacteraceae bacterium]MBC2755056.1 HAMP domain-containing protein [Desulfobacteraceae bacterium]
MKLNSIRFKASILYTSILCIILVLFSGVLFSITRHILYRDVDEELQIKAAEIVNILKSYEKLKQTESRHQHLINKLLGVEDRARLIIDDLWRSDMQALNLKSDYINILNVRGQPIIKSQNFNEEITALFRNKFPLSLNYAVFKNLKNSKYRLRAINMPFSFGNQHLLVIQIGTPLDSVIRILNKLMYFIGAGILFILGLTSFLGSFFARRILKPVLNVTNIVDDISHTDLNLRIPEMEVDEEMKHLISSCNAMIERLEKSFEHVNEFSSHVAHELKTPLAIIRGEVELALSETRDVDEYQRVLNVSLEEIDRLIRIIKDLLLLARLDYNPDVFQFENINLKAFLEEIHEYSSILAEQKGLASELKIPESAHYIDGDKIHLRRLFLNLINNAVKFTPTGGKISITLAIKENRAEIVVSDTGAGIFREDLEAIFDKFFRSHSHGHKAEPGSGLGLSIARSIARAHKGQITVQSRPGQGSAFTVSLPVA